MLYIEAMIRFLNCIFFVLIGSAMIGGPSVQFAHSAMIEPPSAIAVMPCDMAAMPVADAASGKPMVPCEGFTPDCIKQMGCIVGVAILVVSAAFDREVLFATLDFWQTRSILIGTDHAPDLMPPRTI